ncbi:MAG: metallophosphoesterase [Gemmatimonadetes bacterium]|nr:metallophosphoesterase [Gemmatimonadota bacterium]
MVTLLHASDLHFGPAYDAEAGEALLRVAEVARPDVIVLSGDFTQRAKRWQYEEARAYLERLPPVPRVVTPGNHDVPLYRVWERLFAPYRKYRRFIADALDSVIRVPGAMIVALNSTAPYSAIVNGRIRRRQLEFATAAFAGAPPGDARIVVAHHHFAPAPDYEGGDVMPRAHQILDAFHEMGVELVLGGHLHRAYIGDSLDVYAGEARDRGIIIVQSGTTTSRRGRARERAKNSFNMVQIARAVTEITHYIFVRGIGRFAPLSRHVFPRGDGRFLADEAAGERVEAAQ